MASTELDATRRRISVTLDEILELDRQLLAKGINARAPEDREAYDIVCRIERKALAKAREAV